MKPIPITEAQKPAPVTETDRVAAAQADRAFASPVRSEPRTWNTQEEMPEIHENAVPLPFIVKDSGRRTSFGSGMVRDVADDKVKWHKVADGPMLRRWAHLLTEGAKKYPDELGMPNWMKADGPEELQRFKESAFRHFFQWYYGDRDEDHAAAVLFNINGYEYVRDKLALKDAA